MAAWSPEASAPEARVAAGVGPGIETLTGKPSATVRFLEMRGLATPSRSTQGLMEKCMRVMGTANRSSQRSNRAEMTERGGSVTEVRAPQWRPPVEVKTCVCV